MICSIVPVIFDVKRQLKAIFLILAVATIFLGSLAFPAGIPSSASGTASEEFLYQRYFPGNLQGQGIPDLKKNLDSLLQYDRIECGDLVHQEVQLINEYGVKAVSSDQSHAKNISHKIHELLRAAKNAPSRPCLKAAFEIYALGSIFLLDPKNYNSPKVTFGSGVSLTDSSSAMKGGTEVSALSNFPLTYLTAALANQGKLQFFVDPMNMSSAQGRGEREILGAYDCSSSTLHLDPWLPPLDLGATLLHEFDHLFLDKKFTKEELTAEFTNANGSINWRAYVLDDEFTAITHSAIAQRAMSIEPRNYWSWIVPGSGFAVQWSTQPYQLEGDLRLFSKNGPIASLELMFEPGVSTETLLAISAARNIQLTERFLNKRFSQQNDQSVLEKFDKAATKIVDIVNAPYFQNLPLTGSERDLLKAERHGLEFIPLPMWIRDHDLTVSPLIGTAEVRAGNLVFSGPTNFFNSDHTQINRVEISGMGNLLKGIDEMISSMDKPSDVCALYVEAVNEGQLGDYIGTQVQLGTPVPEGSNPGAAGARPGAAGARPGAAGARPLSGEVRPCLSLMHDL